MSSRRRDDQSLVWAAILISVGVVWLVLQAFHVALGAYLWPLWILVPGLATLVGGLALGAKSTRQGRADAEGAEEPLVAIGSVISAVGLLLFYQNATTHWESWAYAWALVAPTAVGLGLWLLGALKARRDMIATGRTMTTIGLILFCVFGIFFELIIGISGRAWPRLAWPIALVVLGGLLVVRALWPKAGKKNSDKES